MTASLPFSSKVVRPSLSFSLGGGGVARGSSFSKRPLFSGCPSRWVTATLNSLNSTGSKKQKNNDHVDKRVAEVQ